MNLNDFIFSLFLEETIILLVGFIPNFHMINFKIIAEKLKKEILFEKNLKKRNGYIKMIGKNTNYPLYFNTQTIISDELIINIIKHIYSQFFKDKIFDKTMLLKIGIYDITNIITKKIIKIKLTEYNIYGCPLSTDCDIAFLTTRENILLYQTYKTKSKNDLDYEIELDFNNILEDLQLNKSVFGKKFDINLIALDENNNITLCLNGSIFDTQNIIFDTYKFHIDIQKYDKFVNNMVDVDLFDKIRGITSFVMKHIEDILKKTENDLQKEKKKMFVSDSNTQFNYVINILKKLNVEICEKSVLKSIVMKLCQIILLNDEIYAYTKENIIENIFYQHNLSKNELWNMLTRDVHGDIKCNFKEKQIIFNKLVEMYVNIFKILTTQYKWNDININFEENPSELDDNLVIEFINSPIIMTEKFKELAKNINLLENIDKYFILETYGREHVTSNLNKYISWIPQRSLEWKKLYLKYNPSSSNITYSSYPLFRGAIGELYVLKYFDFESVLGKDIKKIMVGFLHDSNDFGNDEKCNMCAPDLLIQKDNFIIPVEIKCLQIKPTSDITIKAYYREFKMAQKQLKYYKYILDKINDIKVISGLMIFVFFEENNITTKWTIYDM